MLAWCFSKINGGLSIQNAASRPSFPTSIYFSRINSSSAEISCVTEVSSAADSLLTVRILNKRFDHLVILWHLSREIRMDQSMLDNNGNVSVLFVCMGNICRSPTAEGVFRYFVNEAGLGEKITVDSAGTHAYHVGEPPDRRAMAAAERRGMPLAGLKARRVVDDDFERFDYIIAMDEDNLMRLKEQSTDEYRDKISLFLSFSVDAETEVPDPYYGGSAGFERVLDLVEKASRGLLETLS